jgi:hypothetical protein
MSRQRNFAYCIKTPDINALKNIYCKYHIYGYNNNELHGCITFDNSRTLFSVETDIGHPVKIINRNMVKHEYNRISQMENVWENGIIPKRGRKPKNNEDNNIEIKFLCNLLLKQQEENIKQQEENIKQKEENIKQQEENRRLQMKLEESYNKQLTLVTTPVQQTINANTDNTDNSRNKKITNINLFLNTECKDAITLLEFVKQIEITDADVLRIKQHGYAESVTKLIQNALKEYDLHNRPIHCSDVKREILHVKDDEGWKKETPQGESTNIDKAFRHISSKQNKKVVDYYKDVSIESEEKMGMMHIIAKATGSENEKSKKKVIKNIIDSIHI